MKRLMILVLTCLAVCVAGCVTQGIGERIFLGLAVPEKGNPETIYYKIPVDKQASRIFQVLLLDGGERVVSSSRKEMLRGLYERNQDNNPLSFYEFKYLSLFLSQAQTFSDMAPKELIAPCLAERTSQAQIKRCDDNVIEYLQRSDKEYHAGLERWITTMEKAGITVDEKHRKIILAPLKKTG